MNEFNKAAVTPLEEWIEYLRTGFIRSDTQTPGLEEAREKLKYYNMATEERHAYDEHINAIMIQNDVLDSAKLEGLQEGRAQGIGEGHIKGMEEGIEKGIEKGLKEGEKNKQISLRAVNVWQSLLRFSQCPDDESDLRRGVTF